MKAMFSALLVAVWILPTPAFAGNWMLVGAQGNAPERRHFYAEFDMISQRYDSEAEGGDAAMMEAAVRSPNMGAYLDARRVMRVRVVEVFEKPDAPDTIEFTVGIKCKTRQFRLLEAISWQRNGRSEKLTGTAWAPIPGNWLDRVRLVACESEKLNKAIAAAQKSGKPDSLTRLGLIYAGDMFLGTELSDVTWARFWKDGRRPAYTPTGTPAEQATRKAEALAALREAVGSFETQVQQRQEDLAMQEKMDRALGSANAKFFQEMQGTSGWSEEKVLARWGEPQGFTESNGVRRLVYHFQDTVYDLVQEQMDVIQCQAGACNKVGQTGGATTTHARVINCERILFLKEGGTQPGYRLFDFQINCN